MSWPLWPTPASWLGSQTSWPTPASWPTSQTSWPTPASWLGSETWWPTPASWPTLQTLWPTPVSWLGSQTSWPTAACWLGSQTSWPTPASWLDSQTSWPTPACWLGSQTSRQTPASRPSSLVLFNGVDVSHIPYTTCTSQMITWESQRCLCDELRKQKCTESNHYNHHHHHDRFTALFLGLPGLAGAGREASGLWCKGRLNRGRHTDHPAGRHSIRTNRCPTPPSPIFYRPDALPATQPTVSKHWRRLAHSD